MDQKLLTTLIESQPAHTALPQVFYTDEGIYQREIEEIYLKSWIYAGHLSEIPHTGDWFLFELAGESLIIVRNEDGQVSALVNVCRHRGSKICLENSGCARTLVCTRQHICPTILINRRSGSKVFIPKYWKV